MNWNLLSEPVVPVLAGAQDFITLLFVIIAFLSWVWSLVNGEKKVPGAGPRPPAPPAGNRREKELQAEINKFLRNVMGQPQPNESEDVLEVVEEKPAPRRSRQKRSAAAPGDAAAKSSESGNSDSRGGSRPGGHIAQRKGPGSTNLGSNVRQHLAEHMQDRVVKQAQDHLAHGVAEKVQNDLGSFTAVPTGIRPTTASESSRASMSGFGIGQLMRDPIGVRQAFVLNLILNRPAWHESRQSPTRRRR